MSSPSTHEVRMETAEPSSSTRPLEGGDESSSTRVRSLAGVLLFDENDTSDWQHSVHETRTSELSDDQHDQHDNTDHMQHPDTDIPGVWKWQVESKSDLYGDRTGKLMDREKVVRGRLTELKHMSDHHVYDWIDEASIPKGTKIETSRWCDDIKPRDGDETNVRSRILVQQYNAIKRDEVYQGTPPLKVLRMLLALATRQDAHRRKVKVESGTSAWRSFVLRWMSSRWCDHRLVCG